MKITISSSDELTRIDNFLSKRLNEFSRSKIQKLIKESSITVNDRIVNKNFKLSSGDIIQIDDNSLYLKKENKKLKEWDFPLEVIFKDKDFAIINKPLGIISHPSSTNNTKTLVNILLKKFKKELASHPDPIRPGIVHRLDRDTTGVMIIPFNEYSHWKIADQFKNRTIQKKYIALTWGEWNVDKGIIENKLLRNKKNPLKFQSSKEGRLATSKFKLISKGKYFSSINFFPKTGRTHQIRVHCSENGFPIVGDELYGGGLNKLNEYSSEVRKKLIPLFTEHGGHFLHAAEISFLHPVSNERIVFKSKPSKSFQSVLKLIKDDEI